MQMPLSLWCFLFPLFWSTTCSFDDIKSKMTKIHVFCFADFSCLLKWHVMLWLLKYGTTEPRSPNFLFQREIQRCHAKVLNV